MTEKSRHSRDVSPQTSCAFTSSTDEHDSPQPSTIGAGPTLGINEDEVENSLINSASGDVINMWPWINQVPILRRSLVSISSHMIRLDTTDCFSPSSFGDSNAAIQANGVCPWSVWKVIIVHSRYSLT